MATATKTQTKTAAAKPDKWGGIKKGDRVTNGEVVGVAQYRHTSPAGVAMIGVLVDAKKGQPAKVGGRAVKHVSIAAADLKKAK